MQKRPVLTLLPGENNGDLARGAGVELFLQSHTRRHTDFWIPCSGITPCHKGSATDKGIPRGRHGLDQV